MASRREKKIDKNDLEMFDHPDDNSNWLFGVRWKKGAKYKKKTKNCGQLTIEVHDGLDGIRYSVNESEVDEDIRGFGIGSELYELAIQKFGSLSTQYKALSPWAKRVWLKLIQKYEHETNFWTGYLTVYNKKPTRRPDTKRSAM